MTLNNIKTITKKESGFTIVELLIVIVIIGILAALVIVAYTGITSRANTTKAQTNAVAVQKKAEAYAADNGGVYPVIVRDFTNGNPTATPSPNPISTLPTGVLLKVTTTATAGVSTTTAMSATNGTSVVEYYACNSGQGYQVKYWDFSTNLASTNIITGGSQTSCAVPAS